MPLNIKYNDIIIVLSDKMSANKFGYFYFEEKYDVTSLDFISISTVCSPSFGTPPQSFTAPTNFQLGNGFA